MKLTINLLILTVYVKGELVTYTSVGHVFCLFLKFEKVWNQKHSPNSPPDIPSKIKTHYRSPKLDVVCFVCSGIISRLFLPVLPVGRWRCVTASPTVNWLWPSLWWWICWEDLRCWWECSLRWRSEDGTSETYWSTRVWNNRLSLNLWSWWDEVNTKSHDNKVENRRRMT